MGSVSPASSARSRNAVVISSLLGRPKLMLLTPSTVFNPRSWRTVRTAESVSSACSCWADTVSVRQSIHTSSRGMPQASAAVRIRRAMATRSAAVAGRPFSSRVRPTTAAPYFFTSGSTAEMDSALPLTEFTAALPL